MGMYTEIYVKAVLKENVDEMKKNICPRKEKSDNLDSMELKDKEEE